ncbi:alpha-amylase family glycosyl hydrolase [Mucisphaera sp.]|uniref:PEP-CTERM sorting domain-containing protein n=1 Tax=Mucisphaera sp. TaxID=2913024 RepID=UPI003D146613
MTNTRPIPSRAVTALLCLLAALFLSARTAHAENTSAQPILQVFDLDWTTIDDRMADIFSAGYGRLWLPPPNRADSGGLSVGYDVFDRFDLGTPGNPTLYGTAGGLKTLVDSAHQAGIKVNTDFIPNHNGFSDHTSPGFVAAGDYPGFVTQLPTDPFGDFRPPAFDIDIPTPDEKVYRLAGLIDIAHEKNYQFIRHPVDPADPRNIPSGSFHDIPDPNNARFYTDQDLGGTTVFDPRLNQNVTLYNFNQQNPLAGDPVTENATGLLIRNIRWMIQEVGVDGFRFDAVRHFEPWVLDFLDQGSFLAKPEPLLDGSPDHIFSFSETGGDNRSEFINSYIRKDIDNNNLNELGGNRDALDFGFFFAVRDNLSGNGIANDWRDVKNASFDVFDDGFANNGSQGVAFVQSHDDGPAYLNNVAHAYMLMRPGQAIVYFNGEKLEDGFRDFPKPGRGDALGGVFGNQITTLTNIRNTHGRGNYLDRTPSGDEKEILVFERENSAIVLLSNRLDAGFDSRTVQTAFAPGTPLIELTGNAADPNTDPTDELPSLVVVKPDGTIDVRIPHNLNVNGIEHGNGYLIYGVSGPQGQMSFLDPNNQPITNIIDAEPPTLTGDPLTDDRLNGETRLTDITIIDTDTFTINVNTNAVNLLGSFRDQPADGDYAAFKLNDGLDGNNNGNVDHVTPNSVLYGFEDFTQVNNPGFFQPDGNGLYQQTIDTDLLGEGQHYITTRVFRQRAANEPAVFTDFRQVIYIDREDPEVSFVSLEGIDAPDDRDRQLILESLDGTANSVHVFVNLGASITDQQLLEAIENNGAGRIDLLDRRLWGRNINDLTSGNQKITVVTFERSGRRSIQHLTGLSIATDFGSGIGDLDADDTYEVRDVELFELFLNANNAQFRAPADANGDGRLDLLDLTPFGQALIDAEAPLNTLGEYEDLLARILNAATPGDINRDGTLDAADIDLLYANLTDPALDFNIDGQTDDTDVVHLVTLLANTFLGDTNLDGSVDLIDLSNLATNFGNENTGWAQGDISGDTVVDLIDLSLLATNFGQSNTIPEPTTAALLALAGLTMIRRRNK